MKRIRRFHLPVPFDSRESLWGLSLETALSRAHIELEIGCGVGWHPIDLAKKMKSETQAMIAVERTTEKFHAFRGRLENHPQLASIITGVHGDAFRFIATRIPNSSIDRLWLLYPNPDFKRSNHRWFNSMGFRRSLLALRCSGTFHFSTNLLGYAQEGEIAAGKLGLRLIEKQIISKLTRPDFAPRTHFEKKYFERGNDLFDYVFEKSHEAT
jgi:tRNA G46 methylase TrmB